MKEQEHIHQLYQRFIQGQTTPTELELLFQFFEVSTAEELQALVDSGFSLPDDDSEANTTESQAIDRIDAAVGRHINRHQSASTIKRLRVFKWQYAVAAMLFVGLGLVFMSRNAENRRGSEIILAADIAPGYNQATLTLADGRTIRLDSAQRGIVIHDGFINYQNGKPVPHALLDPQQVKGTSDAESTAPHSLSLATPRGGQYQIILSDGTKVWLNAASTLTYPNKFSGNERTVEISGEAFFDVTEDKAKPFIVRSKNQEISVLGTSFNVEAHEDEKTVTTTLVTGAVQVSNMAADRKGAILLKPGQQSINSEAGIQIKTVDTESVIAWKYGYISAEDIKLADLLRQLKRWYDFDYDPMDVPDRRYMIHISRNEPLSRVLESLEHGGNLHFRIQTSNNRKQLVIQSKKAEGGVMQKQ